MKFFKEPEVRFRKKVVSNDDLAQVMDTSDEWIRSVPGSACVILRWKRQRLPWR